MRGDLDDDVEVVWNVAASGNAIEAHWEVRRRLADSIDKAMARRAFLFEAITAFAE
jgi:hypothetical protein